MTMSNEESSETTIQEGVSQYLKMLDYEGVLPVHNGSHGFLYSLWMMFGREEVEEEIDRQLES